MRYDKNTKSFNHKKINITLGFGKTTIYTSMIWDTKYSNTIKTYHKSSCSKRYLSFVPTWFSWILRGRNDSLRFKVAAWRTRPPRHQYLAPPPSRRVEKEASKKNPSSFLSLFSPIQNIEQRKKQRSGFSMYIDARCVARPAPKTTDSEEHRMERKANNLGCGASLDDGEERNDWTYILLT